MLSVDFIECGSYWVSLMLSVTNYAECRYVERHYADCRNAHVTTLQAVTCIKFFIRFHLDTFGIKDKFLSSFSRKWRLT